MIDFDEQDQSTLEETQRLGKLATFSTTIAAKRKEAIDGRKLSGIEDIWREDEEYINGIDELNRGEAMLKPSTTAGRVTIKQSDSGTRSTVFVNITGPYCDMASARVSDMLLPTNDKPFSIKPTPIPEIEADKESQDLMPDGQQTVGDATKVFLAEMAKKAEGAENQIWDWLVEARWHSEMRKVIEQAAGIGTSCLKGPFPVKRKRRKSNKGEDGTISLIIDEVIKPASKAIDIWNIYPDPSCGESIHNGNFIFERDTITARQLLDLKGTGYIDSEIDAVIKEGPGKKYVESQEKTKETDDYEIWYYHGTATSEELQAAQCECEDGFMAPVVIAMINDRVIKASVSILDSGEFPYDVMVWKRRAGHWSGVGIARQVRTAQRMINAATRNLMDNAGVSAGPQIILKRNMVTPADGVWEITPLKLWLVDEDADIQQAAHAITSVVIPTMEAELTNIIKLALEFAERSTSMPMILQGQQGANTHTVGGMTILQNNSTAVLRNIAKVFDDNISEPHVTRYYDWLMTYGENEEVKGDYNIIPQGSSAFYERDAENQTIMQLVPLSLNPAYGINPEKIISELLVMTKISPERLFYTEEEKKKMQEAAANQPPPNPALDVAKLRAQAELEKVKIVQASDKEELGMKQNEMQSEFALKLQMQQAEHEHAQKIENMRLQVKMMELSQAQNISLEEIKASLAGTTMKLQVQKQLSQIDREVITPPTEPAGQAQDGRSFEQ